MLHPPTSQHVAHPSTSTQAGCAHSKRSLDGLECFQCGAVMRGGRGRQLWWHLRKDLFLYYTGQGPAPADARPVPGEFICLLAFRQVLLETLRHPSVSGGTPAAHPSACAAYIENLPVEALEAVRAWMVARIRAEELLMPTTAPSDGRARQLLEWGANMGGVWSMQSLAGLRGSSLDTKVKLPPKKTRPRRWI